MLARKSRILEEPAFNIALDFSGIPVSSANSNTYCKYINVCVTAQSKTPAMNFVAHLISLSKNGKEVSLGTSPHLGWDNGHKTRNVIATIFPETNNIIHVARITKSVNLEKVTTDLSFDLEYLGDKKSTNLFKDKGIYRFEVVVSNMKTISKKIIFEVAWENNWETVSTKEKGIENVSW